MATTSANQVVRMTADNDQYGSGLGKLRVKGVRLIGGSDAATAQIKIGDTNGQILMSLKCAAANGIDEANICFTVDGGKIHLDLTGTSAEVFIYLE